MTGTAAAGGPCAGTLATAARRNELNVLVRSLGENSRKRSTLPANRRRAAIRNELYDCRGDPACLAGVPGCVTLVAYVIEPTVPVVPIKKRRVWRDLARILSTIFNPFLTALALFVILANASAKNTLDFWGLLLLASSFASIGPMLYVFWLYSTDRISDLDMSVRHEREVVFSAFVVFYLLGAIALWLVHAPRVMIAAMLGYFSSTLIVGYITRYWKISTHALGITAPLVALILLYGRQPLPFLVLVPMVCWARVYLKAHTVAQVVAGAGLGTLTTVLFFRLFHVGLL
jgi:membrane-associated phospholipid phosphatase